eukprot:5711599-Alexandrium_andersonii.AAC.1
MKKPAGNASKGSASSAEGALAIKDTPTGEVKKRPAAAVSDSEPVMKKPSSNDKGKGELLEETEEEQNKRINGALQAALTQVINKKVALTQKMAQLKPCEGESARDVALREINA